MKFFICLKLFAYNPSYLFMYLHRYLVFTLADNNVKVLNIFQYTSFLEVNNLIHHKNEKNLNLPELDNLLINLLTPHACVSAFIHNFFCKFSI